jgi:predicted Zn-dependent protease
LARFAEGGGYTTVQIVSSWIGNVRWARNLVSTSEEVRTNHVVVNRNIRGASSPYVHINDISDEALVAAARRAERLAGLESETFGYDLATQFQSEPHETPSLFSDTTYQFDAEHRATAAQQLAHTARDAGMLSAGYLEVGAHSMAFINSLGYSRYFQYTTAEYSATVRDPAGTGSGWAGVDHYDWTKIDGAHISAVALDKCLTSRNPVRVEPGRYTTILEPQAVCDLVGTLMFNTVMSTPFENGALDREGNRTDAGPFRKWGMPQSLLGERVMDERITISTDPMDPELSFPPFLRLNNMFDTFSAVTPMYHAVTWVEHGILKNLAVDRVRSVIDYGRGTSMLNSGSFRMRVAGPQTSIDEMIATTKRGLLVTRFSNLMPLDFPSQLVRGYTRDGVWLIENGKVTHPCKNLVFTESPLFVLHNVEQLGTPQHVFHPTEKEAWWSIPQPVIVPPLKVRDFSFTALSEAV